MKTICGNYYKVLVNDDQETKDWVFEQVVAFCAKHESFCGESICQCDEPVIEAPNLIGTMADRIFTEVEDETEGGRNEN